MPEAQKDLYAATCNPPRRAKRANVPVSSTRPLSTTATAAAGVEAHPTQSHSQLRAILPMRTYTPRESTTAAEPEAQPPPAKRGRKPGPLSRSAREAQRRLNHSIIEKARRTKINDALATLKQLVPTDYGQPPKPVVAEDDESGDEEEDDDEYDDGPGKSKAKPKPKPKAKATGKKEEKEKEFKLEILVRTVAFLQDLLERVAVLEAVIPTTTPAPAPPAPAPASTFPSLSPTCPNCGAGTGSSTQPKKRKRFHVEEEDAAADDSHHHQHHGQECDPNKPARQAKIPRRSSLEIDTGLVDRTPARALVCGVPPDGMDIDTNTIPALPVAVSISVPISIAKGALEYRPHSHIHAQAQNESSERLPSISSWLHNDINNHNHNDSNSMIDPQLLLMTNTAHSHSSASPVDVHPSSTSYSYLPSPPSSTHFDPVRSSTVPPLLNLGPVATAAMVSSSTNSSSGTGGGGSGSVSDKSGARSTPKVMDTSSTSRVRTPEDESAASLLLQISTSPTFRPVSSSSSSSFSNTNAHPSKFWLHPASDVRSQPASHSGSGSRHGSGSSRGTARGGESESSQGRGRRSPVAQAQTPSSLLGLNTSRSMLRGRFS